MIWIVLLLAAFIGMIGYFIGRHHGFEEGREHELDRAAQRNTTAAHHRL